MKGLRVRLGLFFIVSITVLTLFKSITIEANILNQSYAEYREDYMVQEIKNDAIKDGVYTIYLDEANTKGIIRMVGKHIKSQSTIRYQTEGYNFTIKQTGGEVLKHSIDKDERILVKPQLVSDKIHGDTVITTYELPFWQISKSAIRMHVAEEMRKGRTQEQAEKIVTDKLNSDGLMLYINHQFAVYDGDTMMKGPYDNLNDIKNAVNWSYETKENYLPAYYDIPLKITQKMIPTGSYSIQFVDMTGNESKRFHYQDAQSMEYQIDYILPDSTRNRPVRDEEVVVYETPFLIEDQAGQQYKFNGKAFYTYEATPDKCVNATVVENQVTHKNNGTGKALLLLGYIKTGEESSVQIQYIHESEKGVKTLLATERAGTIKAKSEFNFAKYAKTTYAHQGKDYTYKNKWDYSYYDESGTMQINSGKSGVTKLMIANLLKGSEVTIKLYYKGENPIIVPTGVPDSSNTTLVDYLDLSSTYGQIKADHYGAEKFSAQQGIPTTENLYASVRAPEYLIKASFRRISTTKYFQVQARKKYILKWYTEEVKPVPGDKTGKTQIVKKYHSETKEVKQMISITRQVKYTELAEYDFYKIAHANLGNGALPGGEVTLIPYGYSVPSVSYQHFGDVDQHIIVPAKIKSGVDLPTETIDNGGVKPSIPMNDFTSQVNALIPEVQVKNDVFQFDNYTVINDQYKLKETEEAVYSAIKRPELTSVTTLYQSNLMIPSTISNNTYASNGSILYEKISSFQSLSSTQIPYFFTNINSVMVHTPVYCQGTLLQDNLSFVQLTTPDDDCIPLVLDEYGDSSDFTVSIRNLGKHNSILGYFTRDYIWNTLGSASYIAKNLSGVLRNEVKFPFDVCIDIGNDREMKNDTLLKKDTWYAVGLYSAQRFYLPMYIECGIYTVDFRTIAVNGTSMLTYNQKNANLSKNNYVATDTKKVQVSGKVYGLTLYDIQDNYLWKGIFRSENSLRLKILDQIITKVVEGVKKTFQRIDGTLLSETYHKDKLYYYTVGNKNQFGFVTGRKRQFTLPLIEGSHPQYENKGVLKAGYQWRFTLDTIGDVTSNDNSKVKITPQFFYVNQQGKNRQEVDLYYTDTIQGKRNYYIRVGSELDLKNVHVAQTGDVYLGIPDQELKDTARIRSIPAKEWSAQKRPIYSYGGIVSNLAFKTFSNQSYISLLQESQLIEDFRKQEHDKQNLLKYKQSYYFNYSLPSDVKAVPHGTDILNYAKKYGITKTDNLWLSNGYIIIHFYIQVYDEKGKEYITYDNQKNSMKGY